MRTKIMDHCKQDQEKSRDIISYDPKMLSLRLASWMTRPNLDLTRYEITAEPLPGTLREMSLSTFIMEDEKKLDLSETDLNERKKMNRNEVFLHVKSVLQKRIDEDDDITAYFQLGQLHYENDDLEKAAEYFQIGVDEGDYQAMFQLGVFCYDGLIGEPDHLNKTTSRKESMKRGVELMMQIAQSKSPKAKHLIYAACYNIGRAYFQGYGVKRASDEEAEKWWLKAADDGNPIASVKAQNMLGMFYSTSDVRDLKKAFFWHNEACGNGSIESQGALGVMYLYGLGTKKDLDAAFICLREAAKRGNVYAMGHLISYYYKRRLFTKAVRLAERVIEINSEVNDIAKAIDCLPTYVSKGISMACFYYARCLTNGFGIDKSEAKAKKYYSRSFEFDADTCAHLQNIATHGLI